MAKNITMNKMVNNNYTPYYPENHAHNVKRTTREHGYITGDTLLEVMQGIANTYIAPSGEQWKEEAGINYINNEAKICSVDSFVCILIPYNEGVLHEIRMLVSFNNGTTWYSGSYSNSNTEFRINKLLGAQASIGNQGLYEVVFMGQASSDATMATTYKATFKEDANIPYNVKRFTNQINLLGGGN